MVIDLSVPIDPTLPCWWPGQEPLSVSTTLTLASANTFSRRIGLEEHTGTHFDAPCHTGDDDHLPISELTGDQLPLHTFTGRARVIDVRAHVGTLPGVSPLLGPEILIEFERGRGPVLGNEAVLFWTGWSDRNYRQFPEGANYVELPLQGKIPAWPAPATELLDELSRRGVTLVGIDAPTIGALPHLERAHQAAFRNGITPIESLTNLGSVAAESETLFVFLPLALTDSSGAPGRAVAITFERQPESA